MDGETFRGSRFYREAQSIDKGEEECIVLSVKLLLRRAMSATLSATACTCLSVGRVSRGRKAARLPLPFHG
jgi:hypothetical protein